MNALHFGVKRSNVKVTVEYNVQKQAFTTHMGRGIPYSTTGVSTPCPEKSLQYSMHNQNKLGRPNVSSEGLMFCCRCFFLFAGLPPSCETLPHDRNVFVLDNACPKIRGPSPQRNWGPKTWKIRRDFRQLQSLIANIAGTGQDIQNRKECDHQRSLPRSTAKIRWTLVH